MIAIRRCLALVSAIDYSQNIPGKKEEGREKTCIRSLRHSRDILLVQAQWSSLVYLHYLPTFRCLHRSTDLLLSTLDAFYDRGIPFFGENGFF